MTIAGWRRWSVGVLALVAAACVRHLPSHSLTADLLSADTARAAAMVDADPKRLDAALDDALTYAHSNGRVDSKASLVDALASGRVDYRAIESGGPTARVFDDTGIVTGRVQIDVTAVGRMLHLRSVYTAVYRRHAGHWRLVAYHSSPVE